MNNPHSLDLKKENTELFVSLKARYLKFVDWMIGQGIYKPEYKERLESSLSAKNILVDIAGNLSVARNMGSEIDMQAMFVARDISTMIYEQGMYFEATTFLNKADAIEPYQMGVIMDSIEGLLKSNPSGMITIDYLPSKLDEFLSMIYPRLFLGIKSHPNEGYRDALWAFISFHISLFQKLIGGCNLVQLTQAVRFIDPMIKFLSGNNKFLKELIDARCADTLNFMDFIAGFLDICVAFSDDIENYFWPYLDDIREIVSPRAFPNSLVDDRSAKKSENPKVDYPKNFAKYFGINSRFVPEAYSSALKQKEA